MKALCINTHGDESVFQTCTIPCPEMADDEILIAPLATSINPIDLKIRSGAVSALCPPMPAVLHSDVCAEVIAVGSKTTGFSAGDLIWGCVGGVGQRQGVLQEYVSTTTDFIAKKPENLSVIQAAAMPLVSITAWIGLFEKLQLTRNDHLLIIGGAGGVGHIAAQMAQTIGASVCVTVSNEKQAEALRALGIEHTFNYKTDSLEKLTHAHTQGKGFSAIFDTVGGQHLPTSFSLAATHGRIVTTQLRGATLSLDLMQQKGLLLSGILMLDRLTNAGQAKAFSHYLKAINKMVDTHQIQPLIDPKQFVLKDTSKAHQHAESRAGFGKIIITIKH